MAEYDRNFFVQETYYSYNDREYTELETDDKFEKLYSYILELEERIEVLEKKNDDDDFYYREQQENN